MLIGIDGNEANVGNRVGVNQYAFEILWGLRKLQDINQKKHNFIIYLKDKPLDDMPKHGPDWRYEVLGGKRLWIITKLMPYLYKTDIKPNVFFSPSHYSPPLLPIPRIVSIMDLGYLASPEQFRSYDFWQLKLWTAWSLLVSRKVMAISEATKNDIVKHYPYVSNKIEVALLAGDSSVVASSVTKDDIKEVKKKYLIGKNYILFLSTLKPSKNLLGLLAAWKKISKKFDKKYSLVVAGKKGWLYQPIFEEVKSFGLEDSVVFTDFVSENDKPALLAGAKLFILPSFWEGFGIDVVNSMSLGVPVIVSDRGSLPEVAGSVGLIVNPEDPDEIARNIEKILNMPEKEYNKLSLEAKEHSKKFNWEKTAKKTLEVIESVAK